MTIYYRNNNIYLQANSRGYVTRYVYNLDGKVIETQMPHDNINNGDGLRTSKAVISSEDGNTKTTNYLYSGQYVVAETGDTMATYVRGLNYIAKIGVSNEISYYQYNAHGDVVQMVDNSGVIRNRYDYDVFGEAILSIEEVENSICYAGEFYDASAGLYYLRARYYNPTTGRFITEDTYRGDAFNLGSLNLYAYCYNNPIQFVDPSGHCSECEDDYDGPPEPSLAEIWSGYGGGSDSDGNGIDDGDEGINDYLERSGHSGVEYHFNELIIRKDGKSYTIEDVNNIIDQHELLDYASRWNSDKIDNDMFEGFLDDSNIKYQRTRSGGGFFGGGGGLVASTGPSNKTPNNFNKSYIY